MLICCRGGGDSDVETAHLTAFLFLNAKQTCIYFFNHNIILAVENTF